VAHHVTLCRWLSIITPEIRQSYTTAQMPQIWDELRRKVSDAQSQLPPGVMESIVNDDFGDVFGIYLAITGEGHSYAALKDYADFLRRELLQVPGVANVALNGVQQEQIYVEISREQIAGWHPAGRRLSHHRRTEHRGRRRARRRRRQPRHHPAERRVRLGRSDLGRPDPGRVRPGSADPGTRHRQGLSGLSGPPARSCVTTAGMRSGSASPRSPAATWW